ncbi:MAG TPA: tyrosine-type recombinase/integrase [Chthoniobacterales bacterium]
MAVYVSPVFGTLPVAAIDTGLVLKVFERDNFWIKKTESAVRVRARIEKVLDWAEARGHRPEGVNPASWRKLSMLLPKSRKLKQVKHHTAMPYSAVANFMRVLSQQETVSARALEFTILTAVRAGEASGAKWSEIDFASKVWTIPAPRMKMRHGHRVPLSNAMITLLEKMQLGRVNDFVFPSRAGSLLPNALLLLLRRLDCKVTTHGFRSSFRDRAGNETHHAREVCEARLPIPAAIALSEHTGAAMRSTKGARS